VRAALVGHTGFVGGTLSRQVAFDARFNSADIEEIAGQKVDLLVCAGARAEKWRINREPGADTADMTRLTSCLSRVDARFAVLISTVDVYPAPIGVDEDTWIDVGACTPYGAHRLALEHFIASHFDALIVRLPGLFGAGLKKNVIYDLLHSNQVERIDADAVFQFYDVTRLWGDIERARALGLRLLNVATEPVSVRQLARDAFGMDFNHTRADQAPARYDFRSRHAHLFGGTQGYLYGAERVLSDMKRFVAAQRGHDA